MQNYEKERVALYIKNFNILYTKILKIFQQEKEIIKLIESSKLNGNTFTFKPKITGKLPDFQRLQSNFEGLLESKKQNFVPTVPVAPRCSSQPTV